MQLIHFNSTVLAVLIIVMSCWIIDKINRNLNSYTVQSSFFFCAHKFRRASGTNSIFANILSRTNIPDRLQKDMVTPLTPANSPKPNSSIGTWKKCYKQCIRVSIFCAWYTLATSISSIMRRKNIVAIISDCYIQFHRQATVSINLLQKGQHKRIQLTSLTM